MNLPDINHVTIVSRGEPSNRDAFYCDVHSSACDRDAPLYYVAFLMADRYYYVYVCDACIPFEWLEKDIGAITA